MEDSSTLAILIILLILMGFTVGTTVSRVFRTVEDNITKVIDDECKTEVTVEQ